MLLAGAGASLAILTYAWLEFARAAPHHSIALFALALAILASMVRRAAAADATRRNADATLMRRRNPRARAAQPASHAACPARPPRSPQMPLLRSVERINAYQQRLEKLAFSVGDPSTLGSALPASISHAAMLREYLREHSLELPVGGVTIRPESPLSSASLVSLFALMMVPYCVLVLPQLFGDAYLNDFKARAHARARACAGASASAQARERGCPRPRGVPS
jgi:hypothetical protein